MRYVESGDVIFVIVAIEANYIAVDFHLGAVGGVVGSTFPVGADGDVLRIATSCLMTYWSRKPLISVGFFSKRSLLSAMMAFFLLFSISERQILAAFSIQKLQIYTFSLHRWTH